MQFHICTYSASSLYTTLRPVGSLTSNQVVLKVPNSLVTGKDHAFSCVVVLVATASVRVSIVEAVDGVIKKASADSSKPKRVPVAKKTMI